MEEPKKKKIKKPSAEVIQKRKEGRIKAAATMASNLKKMGIGRAEAENGFSLTNIKPIPLINQKNYFTDYLKKDEQISFIRNWRTEKLLHQKLKNLNKSVKKDGDDNNNNDEEGGNGGIKSFDDFNLQDIEEQMKRKTEADVDSGVTAVDNDEEDEEDDEEENEVGDAENDELIAEKARQGSDVIVFQPGSTNTRLGKATDAVPLTIPTVIGIPVHGNPPSYMPPAPVRQEIEKEEGQDNDDEDNEITFGSEFDAHKTELSKDFKARMRFYKRRILPNSREAAANFNKRQEPEILADHDDPFKKEWLDVQELKQSHYVGEDALSLPICEGFQSWRLRYPIVNGKFNQSPQDYNSQQEILGDLTNLVKYGLKKLDIEKAKPFKCILIIPDLYDKLVVETWIDVLFKYVGFGKVGIIQESVAASFGAGTSSACVVDVGSQTTTVSCVDEGLTINDSRIKLNYGGDNITDIFSKFLLQQHFPYKTLNLNYHYDWELCQNLKHDYATFQDADIAIQHYHFYKRKPFEKTAKYEFKVFDEVMLAPLSLFFPQSLSNKPSITNKFFPPSIDHYSMKSNNPISKAQENIIDDFNYCNLNDDELILRLNDERINNKSINPFSKAKFTSKDMNEIDIKFPLEKAIIESITNAGLVTDFNKAKKFYSNLLIVGGGVAKTPGFDLLLTDRINIWRPKFLSTTNLEDIFEYLNNQQKIVDLDKKNYIQQQDREISDEEMKEIDDKFQLNIDLDYIDQLCDKGQLMPINVLPPPREFDPQMLTWKGGTVYGRLKVVNEMWISQGDWDMLESRSLYYKSLFNY